MGLGERELFGFGGLVMKNWRNVKQKEMKKKKGEKGALSFEGKGRWVLKKSSP